MMKDAIYMVVAAAILAAIVYFSLIGRALPSDAFMAALTLFAAAIVLIPLALRISRESGQQ